jgi:hypothetical protein
VTRRKQGDADHAALLAAAARLRAGLDARYQRYGDSTTPEVVVRVRAAGEGDYVVAVNDRREFGDYVGQHGLVMEHGRPAEAELAVRRPAGHVYDLLVARPVAATVRDGRLRWRAEFGPGEGGVFLVVPRPIRGVTIAAPARAEAGTAAEVAVAVVDESGRPVPAVMPVHVEIRDPAGRDGGVQRPLRSAGRHPAGAPRSGAQRSPRHVADPRARGGFRPGRDARPAGDAPGRRRPIGSGPALTGRPLSRAPPPTAPMQENRRAVWSWAFIDWANSAFAIVVMTAFFPIFFSDFWADVPG